MQTVYLVTGGAGFIGSHIVEALVTKGKRVRVIDNLSTGKRENLQHLMNEIEFIEGDLRDQEASARAVKGVDFVMHQAAIPSVPRSIKEPKNTTENNLNATLHLLPSTAIPQPFRKAKTSPPHRCHPMLPPSWPGNIIVGSFPRYTAWRP